MMKSTTFLKSAAGFLLASALFLTSCRHVNKKVEQFTVKGITFEMIRVDSGSFTMGRTAEQPSINASKDTENQHSELEKQEINYDNPRKPSIETHFEKTYEISPYDMEIPTHNVSLSTFYIGKCEVTQELWKAVMGNIPNTESIGPKLPATYVSRNDCQTFIKKLNKLTGRTFRLPTEAEWEFAARGGNQTKHYIYSGSNNINLVAWYDKNAKGEIHEVGQKKANELGLYDMSGNATELTEDFRAEYSAEDQTNPVPTCGNANSLDLYKVVRGGNYLERPYLCRVSFRDDALPVEWRSCHPGCMPCNNMTGFRLAMSAK